MYVMKQYSPPLEWWVYNYITGGTGYDILTLIGVATDIYSKLSYDDTDCQKKIICEFMEEPDMFGKHFFSCNYHNMDAWITGSGGESVKSGVKYAASWLAPLGFSLVDQITEAATLDQEVVYVVGLFVDYTDIYAGQVWAEIQAVWTNFTEGYLPRGQYRTLLTLFLTLV